MFPFRAESCRKYVLLAVAAVAVLVQPSAAIDIRVYGEFSIEFREGSGVRIKAPGGLTTTLPLSNPDELHIVVMDDDGTYQGTYHFLRDEGTWYRVNVRAGIFTPVSGTTVTGGKR